MKEKNEDALVYLIGKNCQLTSPETGHNSTLTYCIQQDMFKVVQSLIMRSDVDINKRDESCNPPIFLLMNKK